VRAKRRQVAGDFAHNGQRRAGGPAANRQRREDPQGRRLSCFTEACISIGGDEVLTGRHRRPCQKLRGSAGWLIEAQPLGLLGFRWRGLGPWPGGGQPVSAPSGKGLSEVAAAFWPAIVRSVSGCRDLGRLPLLNGLAPAPAPPAPAALNCWRGGSLRWGRQLQARAPPWAAGPGAAAGGGQPGKPDPATAGGPAMGALALQQQLERGGL